MCYLESALIGQIRDHVDTKIIMDSKELYAIGEKIGIYTSILINKWKVGRLCLQRHAQAHQYAWRGWVL